MPSSALGISVDGVGKRHGRVWVLRHVSLSVAPGDTLAILGANGSGKSSLLRLMCGFDRPSEGTVTWRTGTQALDAMQLPLNIAYCAPDQSLLADLTVTEHIRLHQKLRPALPGSDVHAVAVLALLQEKGHVRVRDLSSGMRQRLALALAFSTDCTALFLDEPTSHLDRAGKTWYAQLVSDWQKGRSLVVASNHDPGEYPGAKAVWEFPTS